MVTISFGRLANGFFRKCGNLYFAMQHGRWTFHFPVIAGRISRNSDGTTIYPNEEVQLVPLSELRAAGLDIHEGDNPMAERFWSCAKCGE